MTVAGRRTHAGVGALQVRQFGPYLSIYLSIYLSSYLAI